MSTLKGWMGVLIGMVVAATPAIAWGMTPQEQNLPTPLGYVSDYANLLDTGWHKQIRSVCKDLETNTGVEMLVVTLETIQPFQHAQAYASRLYAAWRIGTAQQEKGILLLIAVQEQQGVVVVGKNLLGVVTPPPIGCTLPEIFVAHVSFRGAWDEYLSFCLVTRLSRSAGTYSVTNGKTQTLGRILDESRGRLFYGLCVVAVHSP